MDGLREAVMMPAAPYAGSGSRIPAEPHPRPLGIDAVSARDETLRLFWREVIRAISRHALCEADGAVFTSEDMDVWLGPWDVEVKHRYRWIEERGGDSCMGLWEPYAELDEGFEVMAAREGDDERNHPQVVAMLNAYYKEHEWELSNR